jgi:hypothetical protein
VNEPETMIEPPDTEQDGDHERPQVFLTVAITEPDGTRRGADMWIPAGQDTDPAMAEALLRTTSALAYLRGGPTLMEAWRRARAVSGQR